MKNCLYCGDLFAPKTERSTCCSRWHSQAYNRKQRPRVSTYKPRPDITSQPPCCQDWRNADPSDQRRTVCPQHQVARKIDQETLLWNADLKRFDGARVIDRWAQAGFTINRHAVQAREEVAA